MIPTHPSRGSASSLILPSRKDAARYGDEIMLVRKYVPLCPHYHPCLHHLTRRYANPWHFVRRGSERFHLSLEWVGSHFIQGRTPTASRLMSFQVSYLLYTFHHLDLASFYYQWCKNWTKSVSLFGALFFRLQKEAYAYCRPHIKCTSA